MKFKKNNFNYKANYNLATSHKKFSNKSFAQIDNHFPIQYKKLYFSKSVQNLTENKR